jgi:hypothetical protein
MQIIQFLVGASYAAIHSFVSYTIPVRVISSAPSASAVSAAATVTGANVLKKLLFRAAGEGGLAANVASPSAHRSDTVTGAAAYTTEFQTIPCVDTSGQTFAIWLNVFYLTPLTALFVRFFVKSYLRRSSSKGEATRVEKAGLDALKGVEKEMVRGEGQKSANGHAKRA